MLRDFTKDLLFLQSHGKLWSQEASNKNSILATALPEFPDVRALVAAGQSSDDAATPCTARRRRRQPLRRRRCRSTTNTLGAAKLIRNLVEITFAFCQFLYSGKQRRPRQHAGKTWVLFVLDPSGSTDRSVLDSPMAQRPHKRYKSIVFQLSKSGQVHRVIQNEWNVRWSITNCSFKHFTCIKFEVWC